MKVIFNLTAIIICVLFLECNNDPKENPECGYGGVVILTLEDKSCSIKKADNSYFLFFKSGTVAVSQNLQEKIYTLLPSNLPEINQIDLLAVTVSEYIPDNPAYSSHNNYTDFFTTEIY